MASHLSSRLATTDSRSVPPENHVIPPIILRPPSPPLQMLNYVLVPQTNFNSTSFDRKELTQIISILLCLHSKGEDLLIIRVSRDRRHREDKGFLEREGLIKESS